MAPAPHVPALTDLELDFYRLHTDHEHPSSCCLSPASASRLASQLRVLKLTQVQDRDVDLLLQLSLHPVCVLESLDCNVVHNGSSPPAPLVQALSKMGRLTTLDVFVEDDFDDPGDGNVDAFVLGLCARSDQCNTQLRRLKLYPRFAKTEDEFGAAGAGHTTL